MPSKVSPESVKRARECLKAGEICKCIKGDQPCEDHQIEAIGKALDSARNSALYDVAQMIINIDNNYLNPSKRQELANEILALKENPNGK